MIFNVVTGAPCAGKTTYIREHKAPGDAVIDFDAIAVAFGADKPHECSELVKLAAKYARKGALDILIDNRDTGYTNDVWVAWAMPSDADRAKWRRLKAVFHDLDTDKEECLRRAEEDGRPQRSINGIETYFDKEGTGQGLTLDEMER